MLTPSFISLTGNFLLRMSAVIIELSMHCKLLEVGPLVDATPMFTVVSLSSMCATLLFTSLHSSSFFLLGKEDFLFLGRPLAFVDPLVLESRPDLFRSDISFSSIWQEAKHFGLKKKELENFIDQGAWKQFISRYWLE